MAIGDKINRVRKIVLFGPESTGKTKLSEELAHFFGWVQVPEYARLYLENKKKYYDYYAGTPDEICSQEDILPIVLGQIALEDTMAMYASDWMICDTNPLQTSVYVSHYYRTRYQWLEDIISVRIYDYYLLTDIDVPWYPDPLRDRPHQREQMLALFEECLKKHNLPYHLIRGLNAQRTQNAIEAVRSIIT